MALQAVQVRFIRGELLSPDDTPAQAGLDDDHIVDVVEEEEVEEDVVGVVLRRVRSEGLGIPSHQLGCHGFVRSCLYGRARRRLWQWHVFAG